MSSCVGGRLLRCAMLWRTVRTMSGRRYRVVVVRVVVICGTRCEVPRYVGDLVRGAGVMVHQLWEGGYAVHGVGEMYETLHARRSAFVPS